MCVWKWGVTAKCEAIASDDAGLNNGVLLPGEGLKLKPKLGQEASPGLDEEEPEQPSRDVEGRDDPDRQIELVRDDAEEGPQHSAHGQPSDRDLLLPFRDTIRFHGHDLLGLLQQRLRYLHALALRAHHFCLRLLVRNHEDQREYRGCEYEMGCPGGRDKWDWIA